MSFAHPTSVERPATFADLNAVPVVDEPNSATKSLTTKKKGFLKRVPNAVSEYAKVEFLFMISLDFLSFRTLPWIMQQFLKSYSEILVKDH